MSSEPSSEWGRRLKRKYGITAEQYGEMLAAQAGGCAICARPPKTRRLAVDHNHKTGKVRGLLCYRCNGQLIRDHTLESLRRAVAYLEKYDG